MSFIRGARINGFAMPARSPRGPDPVLRYAFQDHAKLSPYLYGWRELLSDMDGSMTRRSVSSTMFFGVMLGCGAADHDGVRALRSR